MHLMIDFETLGTAPSSACISLGAVAFNNQGIVAEKHFTLNLKSQLRAGRTIDADTIIWWMQQEGAAKKQFLESRGGLSVAQFLIELEAFIDGSLAKVSEKRDELKPWGNGANFDISILEDFFRRHHENGNDAIPWKFWNVWCYRTTSHLYGTKDALPRRQGTYHNALDDARHQVNSWFAALKNRKSK